MRWRVQQGETFKTSRSNTGSKSHVEATDEWLVVTAVYYDAEQ